MGLSLAAMAFAVVFWLLAIEIPLLPFLIERFFARKVETSATAVESIWFVDLTTERDRRLQEYHDRFDGNPSFK